MLMRCECVFLSFVSKSRILNQSKVFTIIITKTRTNASFFTKFIVTNTEQLNSADVSHQCDNTVQLVMSSHHSAGKSFH